MDFRSVIPAIAKKFIELQVVHLNEKRQVMTPAIYHAIKPTGYVLKIRAAYPNAEVVLYEYLKGNIGHSILPEFEVALYGEMKSQLEKALPPEDTLDLENLHFNDSIPTPLSKLKVIANVDDLDHSALYDPETSTLYNYDLRIIERTLKRKLGKDNYDAYIQQVEEQCRFKYLPYQSVGITRDPDDHNHKILNTWQEASWRANWTPDPNAKEPQEFKDFITHLFPDPSDQHCVKAWLRDATFKRAEPILVLCGDPGVGKNVLIEHIAAALVGESNYSQSGRNFGKSGFHGNVKGARIYMLDEMPLTSETRETLKSFHNGKAAIEEKYKEVGRPEIIYASFVVANNYPSNIRLEYTDRKFYPPKMTETPLELAWGKDKIDRLCRHLLKDIPYLQQLASFLYHNFKPKESEKFTKGAFFEELCINSYPTIFKRFMLMAKGYEEFDDRRFNRGYKVRIEPLELKALIDNYHKTFKRKLVDLMIKADGSWEAVSHVYEPSKDRTNGSGKHDDDHTDIYPKMLREGLL